MRRAPALVIASILGILATACLPSRVPVNTKTVVTNLEIDNREFDDMTVQVASDGGRFVLGSVPGLAARSFVIPPSALSDGSIHITAQARSGTALQSARVMVIPGQIVSWRVERASHGAALLVRNR